MRENQIIIRMNRSIFIDISKAICIVLVVIGHFHPPFSPEWYVAVIKIIYTFHMPLFMFASGYLYAMTFKNQEYGNFLLKKVRRLVIPYFICSLIIIAIKMSFQDFFYVPRPMTYLAFLDILYKPKAGYFLWFVWALWWIFMLIPFFKTKLQRLLLLMIALIVHFYPLHITSYFCLMETQKMLIFFVSGVVMYDNKHYFSICKKVPILVYLIFFCVCEWFFLKGSSGNPWTKFLLAIIGIAFIVSLSLELQKVKNRVVKSIFYLLSSSSYFIYLFHTSFEGLAKAILDNMSLFNKEAISNSVFFSLIVVFVVGFGVLIPVFIYHFIVKKYRLTQLLFGIK